MSSSFNLVFFLTRLVSEDMFAQDSIDLLINCGIQFEELNNKGIDDRLFAELLVSSGLVLTDKVEWIAFHGGYDFGYLLKLLTSLALPPTQPEYISLQNIWFPKIYDIKRIMSYSNRYGGLNPLAADIGVPRVGPMHQAGSDSLLTAAVFFKIKHIDFKDDLSDEKYLGTYLA